MIRQAQQETRKNWVNVRGSAMMPV